MFTIKIGDTSPSLSTTLLEGGSGIDLSNVDEINFYVEDRYERTVIDDNTAGRVNIVNPTKGDVEYVFGDTTDLQIGEYNAEWEVVFDSAANRVETFPTNGYQKIEIVEGIQ